MQHPDEGMIHSWLDGALPAEEATRIESHVAECAQCRAAVAEARGFIAASSRILTALDNVPGGVLPAALPRKRDRRVVWRAAAAMLIVAGGSLVVMRGAEETDRVSEAMATSSPARTPNSPPDNALGDGAAGTGMDARLAAPSADASAANERRATTAPGRADQARPPIAQNAQAENSVAKSYSNARPRASIGSVVEQSDAPAATLKRTPAALAAIAVGPPVSPLKVVGVERRIGERRTIYEVAMGDTVTLSETEALRLEEVVVSAAGAGVTAAAPTSGDRRESAGRSVAPLADRAVTSVTAPPPPSVESQRGLDSSAKTAIRMRGSSTVPVTGTNVISWTDAATGKTFTLSGKLPLARLEEIKLRIEKERAAAGGKAR